MNIDDKIELLALLGNNILNNLNTSDYVDIIEESYLQNPWFTSANISNSLKSIANNYLNKEKLNEWLSEYTVIETKPTKKVGLTLAGNVPLVGFHDIVCTFLSNNIAQVKMSSKDKTILPFLIGKMKLLNPGSIKYFEIVDRLMDFDVIIATGSDSSARYFEYYFGKYPHIIRKNRNSLGILTGKETPEQIKELGKDIFSYFGLGCRNVSKIFVPSGYDFQFFLDNLETYNELYDHFKYSNNHTYRKSIFLLNLEPHYDNDFLLIKQDRSMNSPIATLNYEKYNNISEVEEFVESEKDKIQVIVANSNFKSPVIPFGKSQEPELWDYADNIDTMKFLTNI